MLQQGVWNVSLTLLAKLITVIHNQPGCAGKPLIIGWWATADGQGV